MPASTVVLQRSTNGVHAQLKPGGYIVRRSHAPLGEKKGDHSKKRLSAQECASRLETATNLCAQWCTCLYTNPCAPLGNSQKMSQFLETMCFSCAPSASSGSAHAWKLACGDTVTQHYTLPQNYHNVPMAAHRQVVWNAAVKAYAAKSLGYKELKEL